MSKPVTVTEVSRGLSDFVNRVAYRGESFVLHRGGRPVAELRPVLSGCRLGDLRSILASSPQLPESDVESFANDIDAARESLRREPLRDPWES